MASNKNPVEEEFDLDFDSLLPDAPQQSEEPIEKPVEEQKQNE